MPEHKCKRCGRKLSNKLSIERGYGAKCYKIIQFQETKPEIKPEINQEIAFLKCEIKTIKRMFKQIRTSGVIVDPIERIRQDEQRPEREPNKCNMASVITELKERFSKIENVFDLLSPINPIETPIAPPIMVKAIV